MEWVGYVIFFMIFGGALVTVLSAMPGAKLKIALPKRKPTAEVDPWASWKETGKTLRTARAKEHDDWQADFDRLVQASCAHIYPATGSRPTFYTCWKCKYEEPWDGPHDGCKCQYDTVTSLASPYPEYNVTYRAIDCKWHGIDWPIGQRTDRSNKPFKSVKELYR